jgi:hypothetical protein
MLTRTERGIDDGGTAFDTIETPESPEDLTSSDALEVLVRVWGSVALNEEEIVQFVRKARFEFTGA